MQILTDQKRSSGPLIDRIDLIVAVSHVPNATLLRIKVMQNKQRLTALRKITKALDLQTERFESSVRYNDSSTSREVAQKLKLTDDTQAPFERSADKLVLNARSYLKIIKAART